MNKNNNKTLLLGLWRCILLFCVFFSSAAFSLEEVTLQLKWKHQFQFAGYYAAVEKGFYAEEGLKVDIKERANNIDHIQSVINGDAQFGVADSSLILYRLKGKPVVVLSAIFQHSPLVLMTKSSDHLLGPFELKGKRVMWQKGIDGASITAMFHQLGININDIIHVPQNFDDDALKKGDTDAMTAYVSNQPFYYKRQGIDVHIINPINYGIDFYGDTLFTNENEISSNPERTKRFVKATLKGWKYALENKDETIHWIKTKYLSKSTIEELTDEALITEQMIRPDLVEIGHFNSNRLNLIANIYRQLNMAPANSTLEGIDSKDYLYAKKITPMWVWWLLILAVGTVVLVIFLAGINRRLKKLVDLRTKEIEEQNVLLEETVLKRTIELKKSKEEAETQRDNATEANLEKSRFLANMSHELRTPMHAIMSFSKLALKKHQ